MGSLGRKCREKKSESLRKQPPVELHGLSLVKIDRRRFNLFHITIAASTSLDFSRIGNWYSITIAIVSLGLSKFTNLLLWWHVQFYSVSVAYLWYFVKVTSKREKKADKWWCGVKTCKTKSYTCNIGYGSNRIISRHITHEHQVDMKKLNRQILSSAAKWKLALDVSECSSSICLNILQIKPLPQLQTWS